MIMFLSIFSISYIQGIKEDNLKNGNTLKPIISLFKNDQNNIKYILLMIFIFFTLSFGYAQDNKLIAKAAPITIEMKKYHMTGFDLYDNFDNEMTHYKSSYIPEKYTVHMTGFSMPVKKTLITSKYGKRWKRMHQGVDIDGHKGDTIYAAFSGKVRIVKNDPRGYGYFVVIRHHNGLETYYGHMSKQLVKPNQTISSGEPIGLVGNTGRSTGAHLHFETRLCGKPINPELLFDFKNQDIVEDNYTFINLSKKINK